MRLKHGAEAGGLDASAMLVGFVTSFVVGLASLRLLLALLVRVGLLPFVPYLLVVGLLALTLA